MKKQSCEQQELGKNITKTFLLCIKFSYPIIISGRYCEDTSTKSYSFIDGHSVWRLQEHRRVLVPCDTNVNNSLSNLVPVCRIISLHSQLWGNRSSSKLHFNNCSYAMLSTRSQLYTTLIIKFSNCLKNGRGCLWQYWLRLNPNSDSFFIRVMHIQMNNGLKSSNQNHG